MRKRGRENKLRENTKREKKERSTGTLVCTGRGTGILLMYLFVADKN